MDNDGDLDMVTARVINDGPVTPLDEDLLWFENDGQPSNSKKWQMHRIAAKNTADVFFDVTELDRADGSDGKQKVIVVGSFYKQQMELIWSEDPQDNFKNTEAQQSVILDNAGWYFDVEWHDVDGDGKKELMTTTWSRDGEYGQSIVMELNGRDWRSPNSWSKNVLFGRFPYYKNAGFGSPSNFAFGRLNTDDTGKEHIFISGDDDGEVYVHTPMSETGYRYDTESIYKTDDNIGYLTLTGATIGEILADDFTNDGKTDILIPNYTLNEIIILEQE